MSGHEEAAELGLSDEHFAKVLGLVDDIVSVVQAQRVPPGLVLCALCTMIGITIETTDTERGDPTLNGIIQLIDRTRRRLRADGSRQVVLRGRKPT